MRTHRASRLEIYIEVLTSLEELRACNLFSLQVKVQIGQTFLEDALSFLEKQGLIQQEKVGDETLYNVTAQGERITRYFTIQSEETSCALVE